MAAALLLAAVVVFTFLYRAEPSQEKERHCTVNLLPSVKGRGAPFYFVPADLFHLSNLSGVFLSSSPACFVLMMKMREKRLHCLFLLDEEPSGISFLPPRPLFCSVPVMVRLVCVHWVPCGAMSVALQRLGLSCYNTLTSVAPENNSSHPACWLSYFKGNGPLPQHILKGYEAAVGLPAAAAMPRFLDTLSDATKVILVQEKDCDCLVDIIVQRQVAVCDKVAQLGKRFRRAATWSEYFDAMLPANEKGVKASLLELEASVMKAVPPERLLVWKEGDGWEPICKFLGIEAVPSDPFPQLDSAESWEYLLGRFIRAEMIMRRMRIAFLFMCVLCTIVYFWLHKKLVKCRAEEGRKNLERLKAINSETPAPVNK